MHHNTNTGNPNIQRKRDHKIDKEGLFSSYLVLHQVDQTRARIALLNMPEVQVHPVEALPT